jgi:hypothetical protein
VQGVTTLGAAAAPHLVRAALPVGKKLLTVSADLVLAGFGALNDASRRSRERQQARKAGESSVERRPVSGSDAASDNSSGKGR